MVKYVYDAWGNHAVINADGEDITEGIGVLNPFRYRGYYYDTRTGLYYLQTRFYDPEVGRFISQDSIEYADPQTINGLNLYAYCLNNPVMAVDPDGTMPKLLKWIIGGLAFLGAVALTMFTGGSLTPIFVGMGVSIAAGGLIQGTVTAINGGSFWDGFTEGAADGALWGGIFALGGAIFNTIKVAGVAKQGITIGKTGTFKEVAKISNTYYYGGLKSHRFLTSTVSRPFADRIGWMQNKALLKGVMRFRGAIFNAGGALTGAYAKEIFLTNNYKYIYNIWLF